MGCFPYRLMVVVAYVQEISKLDLSHSHSQSQFTRSESQLSRSDSMLAPSQVNGFKIGPDDFALLCVIGQGKRREDVWH